MRYFNYHPPKKVLLDEVVVVDGKEVKQTTTIDYKQHLKDILKAQEPLDFEEMVRASELFKKVDAMLPGDYLAIDDQDYTIIEKKLVKFIPGLNGIVVSLPDFVDFLKYIKDLPKEEVKNVS